MDIRKAIHIGSSVGITLPKSLLKARNITPGDELEVSEVDSGILITTRVATATRADKITALALNFVDRYRDDLKALADK